MSEKPSTGKKVCKTSSDQGMPCQLLQARDEPPRCASASAPFDSPAWHLCRSAPLHVHLYPLSVHPLLSVQTSALQA